MALIDRLKYGRTIKKSRKSTLNEREEYASLIKNMEKSDIEIDAEVNYCGEINYYPKYSAEKKAISGDDAWKFMVEHMEKVTQTPFNNLPLSITTRQDKNGKNSLFFDTSIKKESVKEYYHIRVSQE
jgi:hypothetical protein